MKELVCAREENRRSIQIFRVDCDYSVGYVLLSRTQQPERLTRMRSNMELFHVEGDELASLAQAVAAGEKFIREGA